MLLLSVDLFKNILLSNKLKYEHLSNEAYRESLINRLSQKNVTNNDDGFRKQL